MSDLPKTQSRQALPWITLILLGVAASRLARLHTVQMDIDEIWTIWQTFGSPRDILAWTPYDWGPLHFLLLGVWRALTGIHPFTVQFFSLLLFLIGTAGLYAFARRVWGIPAGLSAGAAGGAFGYNLYLSTLVRGYPLIYALIPFALWAMQRYFARPGLRRACWLALLLAIMFYTHSTSLVAIAAIGLFGLIVYPRQALRWVLPGGIFLVLAAPELASKIPLMLAGSRFEGVSRQPLPPFVEATFGFFRDIFGTAYPVWFGLALVAAVALASIRPRRRETLAVAIWLGLAAALYVGYNLIGFFVPRYVTWIILAAAFWIGAGLGALAGKLPRWVRLPAVVALCGAMFLPTPAYGIPTSPMPANLRWVATQYRPGDGVLLDPNFDGAKPEEWDYYGQVYFPMGLHFVQEPGNLRRIWYVARDGAQDAATRQAVERGRLAGPFIGPWDFLIRLYEAPPDPAGARYENAMRLHGAEITTAALPDYPVFREGEVLGLRLWWSADAPPPADYSLNVQIVDAASGAVHWSGDGPPHPQNGPAETSQWMPGHLYVETTHLRLPNPMPTGWYEVRLVVYQWWDNVRIVSPVSDPQGVTIIARFYVKSW